MFNSKASLALFPLIPLIIGKNHDAKKRLRLQRQSKSWSAPPKDIAGAVVRIHYLLHRIRSLSEDDLKLATLLSEDGFEDFVKSVKQDYLDFFNSASVEKPAEYPTGTTGERETSRATDKPTTAKSLLFGNG